jgi:hypothetical protein
MLQSPADLSGCPFYQPVTDCVYSVDLHLLRLPWPAIPDRSFLHLSSSLSHAELVSFFLFMQSLSFYRSASAFHSPV